MDKKVTYHEQTDVDNTLRLRDVLKTLPPFCRDFFRAIEPRTTTKTRISYAYDSPAIYNQTPPADHPSV